MAFKSEPTHYIKGILADLQGAWSCLRHEVIESTHPDLMQRFLFHIDEGMSYDECERLR